MRPDLTFVAQWPSDQPARDDIRRTAEEVFARPEYQHHKGLVERFFDWLRSLLGTPETSTGSYSGTGDLLVWLVLFLLLAALVALLVVVVRTYRRRPPKPDDDDVETSIEPDADRTTAEWRSDAERAEAERRWKDALLCRYRELVGTLVDRHAIPPAPGLTTGELRREVARSVPAVAGTFDELTETFELTWYADRPTTEAVNGWFRGLAAELVGRLPDRIDQPAPDGELVEVEA